MSDKWDDLFHIKPKVKAEIVDLARARAAKLLRDKLFVFGCGHSGNLADAAGPALCLTCEIFETRGIVEQPDNGLR